MLHRKIPKDDFVFQVIRDIVRKRGKVDTQEELCYLVVKRLKKYNPEFVLSAKRTKKIALKIPEIKIKAKTRKSPKMIEIKKCPICEGKLRKIFYCPKKAPTIKKSIASILSGYVWDEKNYFTTNSKEKIDTLVSLCEK